MVALDSTSTVTPLQSQKLAHMFFFSIWVMALIFTLWNSKNNHRTQVPSWPDEGLGYWLLHCAVSLAFIHATYWPFAIYCNGLNFDHQIISAPSHCGSERWSPVTIYQSFLQRVHFHPPCQFVHWFAMTDGDGAWKSRVQQTTHQDFLIGVLVVRTSGSYGS